MELKGGAINGEPSPPLPPLPSSPEYIGQGLEHLEEVGEGGSRRQQHHTLLELLWVVMGVFQLLLP